MSVKNTLLNRVVALLDNDITHMGLGIPNENYRKATTSYIDGQTLIKEVYLDDTEGNKKTFTLVNILGNGATDEIGTGEVMIDGNINVPKDNTQSLTVSCEITVETV